MKANEIQVGGDHYKSEVQHWDFAAANFGPGYFRGNATKYLARWRKKNGLEDLQKARHYIQKMAEVDWESLGWSLAGASSRRTGSTISCSTFRIANNIPLRDAEIIELVSSAAGVFALQEALGKLDELIEWAEQGLLQAEQAAQPGAPMF